MNSFLLIITSLTLFTGYSFVYLFFALGITEGGSNILMYTVFVLSIITIVTTIIKVLKEYQDIFNPLIVIIISVVIRVIYPATVLLISGSPEYLSWMNLSNEEWLIGVAFSILAIVSLIFGWLITSRSFINFFSNLAKLLSKYFDNTSQTVLLSAAITTFFGFLLMLVYYYLQAGSGVSIGDGALRGSAEKNGAYRFSYIGLGMIYCSGTFLCASFLNEKRRKVWTAFIPSLISSFILFPTGGRIASLNPIIYALTSFWQIRVENKTASFKKITLILCGLIFFLGYSFFLVSYRTGFGINYIVDIFNFTNFIVYFDSLLWGDISILPVYALSSTHTPGSMEGITYPLILGTLMSFFFKSTGNNLEAEPPGVFLVKDFFSSGREWGPHTGLFIDLYLNSGIIYAIIGCLIVGMMLRGIYEGFLNYLNIPIVSTVYTLLVWSVYWIFFESIMSSTDILYRIVITLLIQRFIFLLLPK